MRRPPARRPGTDRAARRARVQERRAAARAAVPRTARAPAPGSAADRAQARARDRRRKRALLVVLLLVLLALCCGLPECDPPPPPAPAAPAAAAPAAPTTATAGGPALPGLAPQRRPAAPALAPAPLTWLDAFQLQVSARGPLLAQCFVGAPAPGALRWSALVEPHSGRVSDATVTPTAATVALTGAQRACVLGVLAAPDYRLVPGETRSTPVRVGVVLEF